MGITYLGAETGACNDSCYGFNVMVESRIKDSIYSGRVFDHYTLPLKYRKLINPIFRVMYNSKLRIRKGFNITTFFNINKYTNNKEIDEKFYRNVILNPIKGSSGWHSDEGLGLLLNWLIYMDKNSATLRDQMDSPQLIVDEGGKVEMLSIRPNDFFSFNSSMGHTWVSNWDCALIQVPVQLAE